MVLVVDKKFLEGVWWKYALTLAGLQIFCWVLLGYKLQPTYSLSGIISSGPLVPSTFVFFAFLPFVLGRLQLKTLWWCGLIGFALGDAAYFLLALHEPTRRLSGGLLPFISFAQLNVSLLSLGIVIELGRYVYKKVFEE